MSTEKDLSNKVSKIYTLEGNIGSGKSTILKILRGYEKELVEIFGQNVFFVDEPVDKWKKKKFENNTKSPLDMFYSGFKISDDIVRYYKPFTWMVFLIILLISLLCSLYQVFNHAYLWFPVLYLSIICLLILFFNVIGTSLYEKHISDNIYGFTFQILAFTTRLKKMIKCSSKYKDTDGLLTCIMERSMRSDRDVFSKNMRWNEFEKYVYRKFNPLCCDNVNKLQTVMIKVNTPYEKCMERIIKRGIKSESEISLDYLRCLEECHNQMYEKFVKEGGTVITIEWGIIDMNKKEEVDKAIKKLFTDIKNQLESK
jgi:deoxyadenosine/deoxycytidine kinase